MNLILNVLLRAWLSVLVPYVSSVFDRMSSTTASLPLHSSMQFTHGSPDYVRPSFGVTSAPPGLVYPPPGLLGFSSTQSADPTASGTVSTSSSSSIHVSNITGPVSLTSSISDHTVAANPILSYGTTNLLADNPFIPPLSTGTGFDANTGSGSLLWGAPVVAEQSSLPLPTLATRSVHASVANPTSSISQDSDRTRSSSTSNGGVNSASSSSHTDIGSATGNSSFFDTFGTRGQADSDVYFYGAPGTADRLVPQLATSTQSSSSVLSSSASSLGSNVGVGLGLGVGVGVGVNVGIGATESATGSRPVSTFASRLVNRQAPPQPQPQSQPNPTIQPSVNTSTDSATYLTGHSRVIQPFNQGGSKAEKTSESSDPNDDTPSSNVLRKALLEAKPYIPASAQPRNGHGIDHDSLRYHEDTSDAKENGVSGVHDESRGHPSVPQSPQTQQQQQQPRPPHPLSHHAHRVLGHQSNPHPLPPHPHAHPMYPPHPAGGPMMPPHPGMAPWGRPGHPMPPYRPGPGMYGPPGMGFPPMHMPPGHVDEENNGEEGDNEDGDGGVEQPGEDEYEDGEHPYMPNYIPPPGGFPPPHPMHGVPHPHAFGHPDYHGFYPGYPGMEGANPEFDIIEEDEDAIEYGVGEGEYEGEEDGEYESHPYYQGYPHPPHHRGEPVFPGGQGGMYRGPMPGPEVPHPKPPMYGGGGPRRQGKSSFEDDIPMWSYSTAASIFLSEESKTNATQNRERATCPFFLQGICRHGATCRNLHVFPRNVCVWCGEQVKPASTPSNASPAEVEAATVSSHTSHLTTCEEYRAVLDERKQSRGLTCGICMRKPAIEGGRFGLLSHCNHVYCLECIREWRNTAYSAQHASRSVIRSCPQCRNESHFVIPCDRVVTDPNRKAALVARYKEQLSTIPCKHFNKGQGECPFGSSCFYAHVDKYGVSLQTEPPRLLTDADGVVSAAKPPQLCDVLFVETRRRRKKGK